MIPFDEALARVVATARPLDAELVALEDGVGRVLARPVEARFSMPRCNVSAMDGYAVREADLGAPPFALNTVGESAAGAPPGQTLQPGTAMRIFTGGALPAGADRVIVQENVAEEDGAARLVRPFGEERHIRREGSDFRAGDTLVAAGVRLDWKTITAAAAADVDMLDTVRRPRVALIATGDELAAPGMAAQRPGAIPESVSLGVSAFARSRGAELVRSERLPDDLAKLSRGADAALEAADLVVVIGGASVGAHDHSRAMFGDGLDYVFEKVAMKPGKPVWLARVRGRLVLGLPGNPSSALVTARLFLAPLLEGLSGGDAAGAVAFASVVLDGDLPGVGGRETFFRARRTETGAAPLNGQDSSSQSALARADMLLRRPAGAPPLESGEVVCGLAF